MSFYEVLDVGGSPRHRGCLIILRSLALCRDKDDLLIGAESLKIFVGKHHFDAEGEIADPEVEFHEALTFTIDADIFARRLKSGLAERRRDAATAGICKVCLERAFHGPRHPTHLFLSPHFGRFRPKDHNTWTKPYKQ